MGLETIHGRGDEAVRMNFREALEAAKNGATVVDCNGTPWEWDDTFLVMLEGPREGEGLGSLDSFVVERLCTGEWTIVDYQHPKEERHEMNFAEALVAAKGGETVVDCDGTRWEWRSFLTMLDRHAGYGLSYLGSNNEVERVCGGPWKIVDGRSPKEKLADAVLAIPEDAHDNAPDYPFEDNRAESEAEMGYAMVLDAIQRYRKETEGGVIGFG